MTKAGGRDVLAGVKVLDFTSFVAGPYCTRLLADLGADVVKLESPEGDGMRGSPPRRNGVSALFTQLNAGKRSIAVDLKQPAGLALALELAAAADVVVENYRPGVMARLGLGYETIRARNPAIVYCSISGYGQKGPDAAKPAYAPIVHAASGLDLVALDYEPRVDTPIRGRIISADTLGGLHAVTAINAALFRRQRTGEPACIDVALQDGIHNLLAYEFQAAQHRDGGRIPVYRGLKARDGFFICSPVTRKNFEGMALAAGRRDWLDDPRFAAAGARLEHWDELMAELEDWSRHLEAEECVRRMEAAGCPAARYRTLDEAMHAEHARVRGSVVEVVDAAGPTLVPNAPFQFADGGSGLKPFVAALGQHNARVLEDWLDAPPGRADRLAAEGVLAAARG